jgi:hypothetical protein
MIEVGTCMRVSYHGSANFAIKITQNCHRLPVPTGMSVKLRAHGPDSWPTERRNVFADVHELAMRRADARHIGFPWAAADAFRRTVICPLGGVWRNLPFT